MPPIAQSQVVFQSGGKPIRLDAYLPETLDAPVPAVIALHGAGGNVSGMESYASVLAAEGFVVYLLHYFDRTGTEPADLQSMKQNFPLWMKTLWDAISFVETQPQVDRERIALLGFSLGAYLSLANSAIDPRVKAVVEFFGGMPKEMNLYEMPLPRANPARRGRSYRPRRGSLPSTEVAGKEGNPVRNQNLSWCRPRIRVRNLA